nr:MAG TPA: hypothetical protein [Bacteriophage sp.]
MVTLPELASRVIYPVIAYDHDLAYTKLFDSKIEI